MSESPSFGNERSGSLLRASLYTLSAVIALATAEPAQAAVATWDHAPVSLSNGMSFDIDVDGDDADDFTIRYYDSISSLYIFGIGDNRVAADGDLTLFSLGDTVSGTNLFSSSASIALEGGHYYTGFLLSTGGEDGFYGSMAFSQTEPYAANLLLQIASYETVAYAPIDVIPEPSTGIFAALMAVAGALCFWRRSQRALASSDG